MSYNCWKFEFLNSFIIAINFQSADQGVSDIVTKIHIDMPRLRMSNMVHMFSKSLSPPLKPISQVYANNLDWSLSD